MVVTIESIHAFAKSLRGENMETHVLPSDNLRKPMLWINKKRDRAMLFNRNFFTNAPERNNIVETVTTETDDDYHMFIVSFADGDRFGLTKDRQRDVLGIFTGDDAMLRYVEATEPEFYSSLNGMDTTNKIKAIKAMENIPISLEPISNIEPYKGTPHSLSFGYELEFCEKGLGKGDIRLMDKLKNIFKADGSDKKTVDIDIGGGNIITVIKDKYGSEDDVVKIYNDPSIGYEIVTRPFYLNEIEIKMKGIYEKINTVLTPEFYTPYAGGHITVMEGNHMNKPLNPLVVKNVVQITRAFYPQILMIGAYNDSFRGTRYHTLPTKRASLEPLFFNKYDAINKRCKGGDIMGIESRFFSSPNSWKCCEDNAKIIMAIWKTAEKISKVDKQIAIRQHIINKNNTICANNKSPSNHYKKSNMIRDNPHVASMTRTFLSLIETEARKLGILSEIKKRLCIENKDLADKMQEISEEVEERITQEALDMLIKGEKRCVIFTTLAKKYKVNKEFVSKLI